MKVNIKDLKELIGKLNLAVEKSKLNPKSGWIELLFVNNELCFKVSNFDYYLEAVVPVSSEETMDELHATVLAETFIPLVSKLDVESVNLYERLNSLILETEQSSYTFPIIKELGKVKSIDEIKFNQNVEDVVTISGDNLSSVATINTKGLVDAMFSQEVQQFIYVDNLGALTFTENMYVNDFNTPANKEFKLLLNLTQAKLLQIFDGAKEVTLKFEKLPTFSSVQTTTNKVCMETSGVKLILICQNQDMTDKFPSIKLRALGANEEHTHVIVDKKLLDKALARLMVFDKKFDITIMDYSKLVFKLDHLELVSIKNKNFEIIPYLKSENAIEHESIIRFADLTTQLKAVTSKEIDISYGSRPAISINGNIKQLIPEIRVRTE